KQLDAGRWPRRGKNVYDIAPDTELTAQGNEILARVAKRRQLGGQLSRIERLAELDVQRIGFQLVSAQHSLHEGARRHDHKVWLACRSMDYVLQHLHLPADRIGAGRHLLVGRDFRSRIKKDRKAAEIGNLLIVAISLVAVRCNQEHGSLYLMEEH